MGRDVHRGEIVTINGPSGFGKSTFIHCVNDLEIPTEGTVTLGDVTTNAHDRREMTKLREDVGMMSQE
ncbi:ATP-binding cassette domain-containing protein [Caballeronia sordidicola]|uniref:ATP-binding cassette domain-containing protein n=1 Tax=Caballeronia sordidicola TaxID=196367 RepID=UPI00094D7D7A